MSFLLYSYCEKIGANTKCRKNCQVLVLGSRVVWKKGQKGQWGGAEGIKNWQKVVGTSLMDGWTAY